MAKYVRCPVCKDLFKQYGTIENICIICYNKAEGENVVESKYDR